MAFEKVLQCQDTARKYSKKTKYYYLVPLVNVTQKQIIYATAH